ncbi:MAG: hypothetical protein JW967_09490 [Dehalococcoidales bacterium]|nr:hypothetical protein [Dehalococcoidales bacterium]
MEIKHRVGFALDEAETTIKSLGIKYKKNVHPKGGGIISFDIYESDERWSQISKLRQEVGGSDIYDTVFTKQEIIDAEWSRLIPRNPKGYPQPEDGWKDLTYQGGCHKCGSGYVQKAPFGIKEPQMGKKDFMDLYWTHAVFCTPKVAEVLKAEKINSLEFWDAILPRTKQPSKAVSQLFTRRVTEAGLSDEDKIKLEVCTVCGMVKYAYHKRGYMYIRREALNDGIDIQLTHEWFGSGGHGFQEILISNRFAKIILENDWKGIELKPIKLA